MSRIAILIENDKYVGTMNLSTGEAVGADNTPTAPVPAPVTDIIAALFMRAKGQEIPVTHGWWDAVQTGGGSTFLLGSVSPDANGDLPLLFISDSGERKITWPANSEAYLPLNFSSGLPQGTKVSIKTYGVPDTGSEIYATLSPNRAAFDGKTRTVANTFNGVIAQDLPGYTRMDAGSKLWLNLGGKGNDGYTAVQVTIQLP